MVAQPFILSNVEGSRLRNNRQAPKPDRAGVAVANGDLATRRLPHQPTLTQPLPETCPPMAEGEGFTLPVHLLPSPAR